MQEKLDILSYPNAKVSSTIKKLLDVEVDFEQNKIGALVAGENLKNLKPVYLAMVDRIDSIGKASETQNREKEMDQNQKHFVETLKQLVTTEEGEENDTIRKLNPKLRSLVLHSLAVLLTLEERDRFPLLQLFSAMRTNSLAEVKTAIAFLNVDYALCRVIGESKDDRLDVEFYQCREPACKEHFYAPKDQNVERCDFCPRGNPKKQKSRRKYQKRAKSTQATEMVLNPVIDESVVIVKEENLVSFRVLMAFRHCVLLGLKGLFPTQFATLFKLNQQIKARESMKRWRTDERYLAGHIEGDLDYLKRIYGLRIKPYHLMHKLFARLAADLGKVPGTWEVDRLEERTLECLGILTFDMIKPMEPRIRQIGQNELDKLRIQNQWHNLENSLDELGRVHVSESRVDERVFEVGALRNQQRIGQGHVKEALIMGTLKDGFLKEMFELKQLLIIKSEHSSEEDADKNFEINFIQDFLLSCLELSRWLSEKFEVEFNEDELHEASLFECVKEKFNVDLREKWDDFVRKTGVKEEDNDENEDQMIAKLFIDFKNKFGRFLRFCKNENVKRIFPFISEQAHTSFANSAEEFGSKGEFKKISLDRLKRVLDDDEWTLAMLLVHSELAKKSLVMRICLSLANFQNRLIQSHAHGECTRTVNIYNYSEDKIADFIAVQKDFAQTQENTEELMDFGELIGELEQGLIRGVVSLLPHVVAEARENVQYRFKREKDKAKTQLKTLRRRYSDGRLPMETRIRIRKKASTSQQVRLKMFEYMKKVIYVLVNRSDVPGSGTVSELMQSFGHNAEGGQELQIVNQCRVEQVADLYEEVEAEAFEALKKFGRLKDFDKSISKKKFTELKKNFIRQVSSAERKLLDRGFRKLVIRLYHIGHNKDKLLEQLAQRHLELFRSDEVIRLEEECDKAETNQSQLGEQMEWGNQEDESDDEDYDLDSEESQDEKEELDKNLIEGLDRKKLKEYKKSQRQRLKKMLKMLDPIGLRFKYAVHFIEVISNKKV